MSSNAFMRAAKIWYDPLVDSAIALMAKWLGQQNSNACQTLPSKQANVLVWDPFDFPCP